MLGLECPGWSRTSRRSTASWRSTTHPCRNSIHMVWFLATLSSGLLRLHSCYVWSLNQCDFSCCLPYMPLIPKGGSKDQSNHGRCNSSVRPSLGRKAGEKLAHRPLKNPDSFQGCGKSIFGSPCQARQWFVDCWRVDGQFQPSDGRSVLLQLMFEKEK